MHLSGFGQVALTIGILIGTSAQAAGEFTATITGCEGKDMSKVLAELYPRGTEKEHNHIFAPHKRGNWTFENAVQIKCFGLECDTHHALSLIKAGKAVRDVSTQNFQNKYIAKPDGTAEFVGNTVVITAKNNSTSSLKIVKGEMAESLRQAISARAFTKDGLLVDVITDLDSIGTYSKTDLPINIRIRNEIRCNPETGAGALCEIESSADIFVPYNELHECKDEPDLMM